MVGTTGWVPQSKSRTRDELVPVVDCQNNSPVAGTIPSLGKSIYSWLWLISVWTHDFLNFWWTLSASPTAPTEIQHKSLRIPKWRLESLGLGARLLLVMNLESWLTKFRKDLTFLDFNKTTSGFVTAMQQGGASQIYIPIATWIIAVHSETVGFINTCILLPYIASKMSMWRSHHVVLSK